MEKKPMLSDKFIRFTLPGPMKPSEEQAFGMFVNDYISENIVTYIHEGIEDVYDGITFETDQGYSIEFALAQDLDDTTADAIVEAVFQMFENCVIEVSGDK